MLEKKFPMETVEKMATEEAFEEIPVGDDVLLIKKHLPLDDAMGFVTQLLDICFADGRYAPEAFESTFNLLFLKYETNVPMIPDPEDPSLIDVEKMTKFASNIPWFSCDSYWKLRDVCLDAVKEQIRTLEQEQLKAEQQALKDLSEMATAFRELAEFGSESGKRLMDFLCNEKNLEEVLSSAMSHAVKQEPEAASNILNLITKQNEQSTNN